MYEKIRTNQIQKSYNTKSGKSGFTLVELSVVLALLAILATMIASFSVLMNGFASKNNEEYNFLEDYAKLKEEISEWVAENDVNGITFTVENGTMIVGQNETNSKTVSFGNGSITVNNVALLTGFDTIESVTFSYITYSSDEVNEVNKLIKCEVKKSGEETGQSFVFSLRCGVIGG